MSESKNTSYSHLIPFGYAPGGYMAKCGECGEPQIGVDKRAWRCRECAERAFESSKTAHLGGGI